MQVRTTVTSSFNLARVSSSRYMNFLWTSTGCLLRSNGNFDDRVTVGHGRVTYIHQRLKRFKLLDFSGESESRSNTLVTVTVVSSCSQAGPGNLKFNCDAEFQVRGWYYKLSFCQRRRKLILGSGKCPETRNSHDI